ncbi:Atg23p NDAI_0J02470 [Naumovozyma dairenensis CBS 421]|uniref:Autophagy-related protein 23 n=1 Tax=Naumovozyma dairenensis (strain ATCC 10597 / BCRC 20456 / CBS 421 / NBRC 0211 / NRRL Y-12639) TaxID=1071378 RepID=G0WH61_NAUDC|nr:hypothetical protein NDAI_0J02470 [Naumovozyma dairenensis CBS 421]CCD27139.1 hypothetical protein NDAI_0J02470 [Naumovozyma dairenensis CBS 421]
MQLDELLKQQEEISNLLDTLILVHKNALIDDTKSSISITNLRKDIAICFNDIYKLNDMLISFDGESKETISFLTSNKDKFIKLINQETELLEEQKHWSENMDKIIGLSSSQEKPSSHDAEVYIDELTRISITSSYRSILNQYIELVGITNTSLASEQNEVSSSSSSVPLSRDDLFKSMELLQATKETNLKEIKQLESLLKNFRKDQTLIENELKRQRAKIQNEKLRIQLELNKLNTRKSKLISSCGYNDKGSHQHQSDTLTHKLLNFSLENRDHVTLEEDRIKIKETNSRFLQFIDVKIESLRDQLAHRKDNSSTLLNQKNIWYDCIDILSDLENSLVEIINTNPMNKISSRKMVEEINTTIEYLSAVLKSLPSNENDKLKTLLENERSVLQKAYDELYKPSRELLSQDHLPSLMENSHSDEEQKNISPITTPPFVVASKSPPKIGTFKQDVQTVSQPTKED